jgi:alkylhydroperoxidase/carboxymuconolactone decarboxylase family protein YurZ|tara:strand:+ start:222 stop:1133 length:912 start_codon:yes stop_codon:yes gene_type:complete
MSSADITPDEIMQFFKEEFNEVPEHIQFMYDVAPTSLQGHYTMWNHLFKDPSEGGAIPKRYKALVAMSIAKAARNKQSALWWTHAAMHWGLKVEELTENVCFNLTGQGLGTFIDIGSECLKYAIKLQSNLNIDFEALESMPELTSYHHLGEKLMPLDHEIFPVLIEDIVKPTNDEEKKIHEYFQKSFNAPMPEFWALLGKESLEMLEGYFLLRKETMKREEEGGFTPKIIKELNAVAIDTLLHNDWGGTAHLRAALVNGATIEQVREIEGLVIMEAGMVAYKMSGVGFVKSAAAYLEKLPLIK